MQRLKMLSVSGFRAIGDEGMSGEVGREWGRELSASREQTDR